MAHAKRPRLACHLLEGTPAHNLFGHFYKSEIHQKHEKIEALSHTLKTRCNCSSFFFPFFFDIFPFFLFFSLFFFLFLLLQLCV